MTDSPMVKVKLTSPDGDVETLWATPVGEDRYKLENSPFFAYGVSWLDVVEAREDALGQLAMTRVVEKSGHRTVRLILDDGDAPLTEADGVVERLQTLGCSYEGYNRRYLSLDIPPGANFDVVVDALVRSGVQWEHADPTYGELYESEGQ